MKTLTILGLMAAVALADDSVALRRDPGPVKQLDLAGGPGGIQNAPSPPFKLVSVETRGRMPKAVVTDSRGVKWMVKFGEEAKAETFASRIAWAAGYPTRASYFVAQGQIPGLPVQDSRGALVDANGNFRDARFQMFDNASVREVPGGKLDFYSKKYDQRELNGLKLLLLLTANWDVKADNRGVLEIDGKRYATVLDWGASFGDPNNAQEARKWNCSAYDAKTETLIAGVDNGFVEFNYQQYAGKDIESISRGIPLADMHWFAGLLDELTDDQLLAGLKASGASAEEATCFAKAIRRRLTLFKTATEQSGSVIRRTRTKIIRQ